MKLTKWVRSHFQERLPLGMSEFKEWIADIAELTTLPDNDKLRAIVAEFIIRLPPNVSTYSKMTLAQQIQKAAANQVAFEAKSLIDEKSKAKAAEPSADQAVGQAVN